MLIPHNNKCIACIDYTALTLRFSTYQQGNQISVRKKHPANEWQDVLIRLIIPGRAYLRSAIKL